MLITWRANTFFQLWYFLKNTVYCRIFAFVLNLKDSIRCHVLDIPTDSLVVENMVFTIRSLCSKRKEYTEQVFNICVCKHIQYLYLCSSTTYRRNFVLIFSLVNIKRIISIMCSTNFVSFVAVELIP